MNLKSDCQSGRNLVKDENGSLHGDSHTILIGRKNYISHLLNAHRVSDVRQIETRTAYYKAETV
jgi:hypothetical protein